MTPNARFIEFIKDITPSATTNARSKSAHTAIRNALISDEDYGESVLRTFLGGSYRRKTAIRPVAKGGDTDRPDVDIYVVVEGTTSTCSPSDLVNDLYNALNRHRRALYITKLKRNRCSIAISTNKADMDVSPLLDRGHDGYYRIGNRNSGEWYATDPEAHTDWSAEVNADAGLRFNPMVKLMKWSRRQNPTISKHPKSIGLEALVAKHMPMNESHYGVLIHDTFDDIVAVYSLHSLLGTCPSLDDPAVNGGNLLGGVSGAAWSGFYDKVKYLRDEAAKALDADDQSVATKHWRRVFGPRFPSPKTANAEGAIGLKSAAVVAPLTFPSEPARPPRKPAYFA